MWVFHSPIGPIYIKRGSRSFTIEFGGNCYGSYQTAEAAADDVFTFSTGCDEWDFLCEEQPDCPYSLKDWEYY